jgi:hypothetical protein
MKITTRQYITDLMDAERRLNKAEMEADRRYNEAEFTSVRRAVDRYSETNDERWVGANEFRGQLKDQAGTFLTRRELWFAIIALAGVMVAIVQIFMK